MELKEMTAQVQIIQSLSDYPNQEEGLTAGEMKAKFDEAAVNLKAYLNDQVVPAVNSKVDAGNLRETVSEAVQTALESETEDLAAAAALLIPKDATLSADSENPVQNKAIYAALQEKVSNIYGLPSTVNPPDNDLDNLRTNGWYSSSGNTVGMPTGLRYIEYGTVLVINRYGNDTTQLFVSQPDTCAGAPYLLVRNYSRTNSAWNPWEWINPPMALNTEYRTTKRWNGKPVYTKAIDIGSLPNNSSKSVAHGIIGNTEFVSVRLLADSGSSGFELVNGGVSSVYVIGQNIQVSTGFDASSYSGKAVVEYTKN